MCSEGVEHNKPLCNRTRLTPTPEHTAVQSRSQGVYITEGSCTKIEWIGRGLQTATHLNLPRGGVDNWEHSESHRRCFASPK
jgi:hypothetical protein